MSDGEGDLVGQIRKAYAKHSGRDDWGVVARADDVIEVMGEIAEFYGIKPPLPGRVEFSPRYVYDLTAWSGTGMPGRIAYTYLGWRVRGEVSS